MAHANIVVTNAGVEMWTDRDRITFPSDDNINYYAMPNLVTQFQEYLDQTQKSAFGTTYAVGVLIAKKNSVQGGYSQGPPCSTSGVSLINYRPMPWTIGGLIAHELAHTLSVVHPSDLAYICAVFKDVPFCQTGAPLPEECLCNVNPSQCLMTFYFGQAKVNAPRYTPCDIQMMNHFSSNIPCLLKVDSISFNLSLLKFDIFSEQKLFLSLAVVYYVVCTQCYSLVWIYFFHL